MKQNKKTDNLELLLTSEDLDLLYKNSTKLFNDWLNNNINEENRTLLEKEAIKYYQLLLEQQVPSDLIYNYMDYFRSYGIDDFIDKYIEVTSKITQINPTLLTTKALCIKKEKLKSSKLILKK